MVYVNYGIIIAMTSYVLYVHAAIFIGVSVFSFSYYFDPEVVVNSVELVPWRCKQTVDY